MNVKIVCEFEIEKNMPGIKKNDGIHLKYCGNKILIERKKENNQYSMQKVKKFPP